MDVRGRLVRRRGRHTEVRRDDLLREIGEQDAPGLVAFGGAGPLHACAIAELLATVGYGVGAFTSPASRLAWPQERASALAATSHWPW